ncbi:uncharacterized protein LOC132747983 [Ruditapes philippinarum]|uniref:uncharacterized protein LOC132747983 n=1 Tax=Ruditapes philippinarum TaxID=129788 RepID=UPI00295ADC32|nr:uncharacterized protein LOC132747983 [Ruditapes philippinarum]
MENRLVDFTISIIVLSYLGSFTWAKPCNNVNHTYTGNPNELCGETTTQLEKDISNSNRGSDSKNSGIAIHTVYTIIVISGVILIPIIVLTRVCWLRKLQRQRCEVINEMRQIVDERFTEEQMRTSGMFSLDLSNLPPVVMLGKPPSYEESIANPCSGSPPPYDDPLGYKNNHFDFGENITNTCGEETNIQQSTSSTVAFGHETENVPVPSTSSNNSNDCVVVNNEVTFTSSYRF